MARPSPEPLQRRETHPRRQRCALASTVARRAPGAAAHARRCRRRPDKPL